ncbi:IS1634 family transposase [Bacteroides sp. 519]|uniref:IS1634 family transposase n=1 Tax=Bacteroides sp. 519 TaxID=2302937 RepID=UPI0013D89396|nr:IS1634 family transposase [Bacteroides sp. 519]NDV60780.1 IS1634 family transposase [Bacteroides sp. 519]
MHVNVQLRFNPSTGEEAPYYRLKESYRDVRGNVHSLIVLNIGFEPSVKPLQVKRIAQALTSRFQNRNNISIFNEKIDSLSAEECLLAEKYWQRMVNEGGIDRFNKKENISQKEAEKYIDLNSVEHTDARNVGAEWLCKQTIDKLDIEGFLNKQGWNDNAIHAALSHLIVRTVYSPSECATHRIMKENSAACELYSGNPDWTPGINTLYQMPDRLYAIKDDLERHLCNKTDNLFNISNHIVLFDLTNFYFEGRKASSRKAHFGRSKEKRSDCRLLVLALCINKEGFIRYSSILEGNASDPKSLPDMIDKLAVKSPTTNEKTLVVIDAGISTEDNLQRIKEKGYNYLCVSRTRLKDYTLSNDHRKVTVRDTKQQEITLREVKTNPDEDYYLEITSPSKAMTEASMHRVWRERFEDEMNKINESISKKGGTKRYEKVVERVGRAIERYPSIARHYRITYLRNETKPAEMGKVDWGIKNITAIDKNTGVYFLRTNVRTFGEETTWEYYNLIREIECTNRQLKTDLNLRPIYHQKDDRSDAHLFFGLLAYWVVNTIRLQLKLADENCYWTEIVRRMSTQKLVTTEAVNALGDKVTLRQCSRPTKQAEKIYSVLKLKYAPFKKIKICRTQPPPE